MKVPLNRLLNDSLLSTILLKILMRILLVASACTFLYGYYDVECLCLILYPFNVASTCFVNKWDPIVTHDLVNNLISTHYVLPDKIGYGCFGFFAHWYGFHPFCKILDGTKYPNISFCYWINWFDKV